MLCIIVPTLGNRSEELKRLFSSLDNQTNKHFYVLCMVQGNYDLVYQISVKFNFEIHIHNLSKIGLSFARNIALNHVKIETTFITFSDDDCWYPPYMVDKISNYKYADNECICFNIYDPFKEKYYKSYPHQSISSLSKRDILKVSSIEIFVPRSIIESKIYFDEKFGLGTNYPSGEENIFLFDLLDNKYKIRYFPHIIVYHAFPDWISKEYIFNGKGALFVRLFNKPISIVLVVGYSILKFKYFTNFRLQFLKMFKEIIDYK